jgi:hypothetical protein
MSHALKNRPSARSIEIKRRQRSSQVRNSASAGIPLRPDQKPPVYFQRPGIAPAGVALFLRSRFISRQVASSV